MVFFFCGTISYEKAKVAQGLNALSVTFLLTNMTCKIVNLYNCSNIVLQIVKIVVLLASGLKKYTILTWRRALRMKKEIASY